MAKINIEVEVDDKDLENSNLIEQWALDADDFKKAEMMIAAAASELHRMSDSEDGKWYRLTLDFRIVREDDEVEGRDLSLVELPDDAYDEDDD